jgi:hypothetical protein
MSLRDVNVTRFDEQTDKQLSADCPDCAGRSSLTLASANAPTADSSSPTSDSIAGRSGARPISIEGRAEPRLRPFATSPDDGRARPAQLRGRANCGGLPRGDGREVWRSGARHVAARSGTILRTPRIGATTTVAGSASVSGVWGVPRGRGHGGTGTDDIWKTAGVPLAVPPSQG